MVVCACDLYRYSADPSTQINDWLAELNEIPDLRRILRLAGMDKLYDYKYKYNSDFRVNPTPLSEPAGAAESKLINLLYLHEQRRRRHIFGNLFVFRQPIQHFFRVARKTEDMSALPDRK